MLLLLAVLFSCKTPEPPPPRGRSARVRIVVADTSQAVHDVTTSVEAMGGYLEESEVWREGEQLRARLTLRVPPAKLTPALAAIRNAAARVETETVTGGS